VPSDCKTFLAERTALIGKVIGVSDWITVDQKKIDDFAQVTEDDQFIHVDPDRAKAETPFGGTIAHGFLTLSLCSKFAMNALPPKPKTQKLTLNYGLNNVRFLNPVGVDEQLRGRFVLQDAAMRAVDQVLQTYDLTVEIKGRDKPALAATWLALAVF